MSEMNEQNLRTGFEMKHKIGLAPKSSPIKASRDGSPVNKCNLREQRCNLREQGCNLREQRCNLREQGCNLREQRCNLREQGCNLREQRCNLREQRCNLREQGCNLREHFNAPLFRLVTSISPGSTNMFQKRTISCIDVPNGNILTFRCSIWEHLLDREE
jgi:hypothetical protein